MSAGRFLLPLVLACALAAGCQTAGEQVRVRSTGDVCLDVAYAFYLIAAYEDRGDSYQHQLDWAYGTLLDHGSFDTQQALADIVTIVHRFDANPYRTWLAVRDNCSVNRDGDAVIARFWPKS